MSSALYPARLYWVGLRGSAHVGQARVVLAEPPRLPPSEILPAGRVSGIDYIPAIGLRQVTPYAGCWRDMTDAECAAARALLERLTGAAP